jgi:hypothetical protein
MHTSTRRNRNTYKSHKRKFVPVKGMKAYGLRKYARTYYQHRYSSEVSGERNTTDALPPEK